MSEKIITRPWSEEEDRLLRQGVALHGEQDNWKIISATIPGRTNKACRKRWLHSLNPNVKKTAWETDEDKQLLELYDTLGPKWSAIARKIPGRTDDACSKRYREALDPSLKKDQWTPEEDQLLLEAQSRLGMRWSQVGQELQRSSLACRNRFRLLGRRKPGKSSQTASPNHAIAVHELPLPVVDIEPAVRAEEMDLQVHWTPYYPPEAYPTFPDHGDHYGSSSFREPTPEILEKPDPQIAPFKPTSSSLSAALSDPPRPPQPLPPVSVSNTPELLVQDIPNDSEGFHSLSPLSQCNNIPEMNDILMSLDDFPHGPMEQHSLNIAISQPYNFDSYNSFGTLSDFYSASPISIPSELSRSNDISLSSHLWKARAPELEFDSPHSTFGSTLTDYPDDYSSTASTPYFAPRNISPVASPLSGTLLDLPSSEQPSSQSLLFSPPNTDIRSSNPQRTRKSVSRKIGKSTKLPAAARLSSNLTLSDDPNVRPYACGRPDCWPSSEAMSRSCFATSGELLEHSKEDHSNDGPSDKPYRCALKGCDKSWKSINGLQYHLQISTAHFTTALFNRFSTQPISAGAHTDSNVDNNSNNDAEPERKYTCPLPGCYKAYRQPSGLRYHVNFGHPSEMPAQMQEVPPVLASQIPIKAKKLRPKSTSELIVT